MNRQETSFKVYIKRPFNTQFGKPNKVFPLTGKVYDSGRFHVEQIVDNLLINCG